MKRLVIVVLGGMICTGCSISSFLQGNVFEEVWQKNASESFWSTSDRMLQDQTKSIFSVWAETFEKKKSQLVRIDEEGKLQGTTVLLGKNLELKRKEYQASLEKIATIQELQERLKTQTGKICEYQKSSVKCDL